MERAIQVQKQTTKFIKPFVPTLPSLDHYKLGFIDEFCPPVDVGFVLFFSTNTHDQNPNFIACLERSLEKILARFYPLAGRYVEETRSVDCNDQGAKFIHATVNVKLQDFLVSEDHDKFIDDFIPSKLVAAHQHNDPLLAVQVTAFKCGGVAIGACALHKIVDASTLCTLVNEWALANREGKKENEVAGHGFSSLFPARGVSSFPVPPMNDEIFSKYTRKKLSFTSSVISNMKAKGENRTKPWSKVQLITSIIWKAFIGVDLAIHGHLRESMLIQAVNLREKMASMIPKNSCGSGNLVAICTTECKNLETTEELADRLSDCVKKTMTNFSKGRHDSEEGQAMVLNSYSCLASITESTNVILVTSWCKFPFYDANFGFGKPVWAAPGITPIRNSAYLMDDAEGNGVETYVFLKAEDVPRFKEALELAKAFVV